MDIKLSNVVVPLAKKYFYPTYMQNMLIPRTSKSLTLITELGSILKARV